MVIFEIILYTFICIAIFAFGWSVLLMYIKDVFALHKHPKAAAAVQLFMLTALISSIVYSICYHYNIQLWN
jgi:divalent metal cation (Fe/Co/Zn/Cd) transporter